MAGSDGLLSDDEVRVQIERFCSNSEAWSAYLDLVRKEIVGGDTRPAANDLVEAELMRNGIPRYSIDFRNFQDILMGVRDAALDATGNSRLKMRALTPSELADLVSAFINEAETWKAYKFHVSQLLAGKPGDDEIQTSLGRNRLMDSFLERTFGTSRALKFPYLHLFARALNEAALTELEPDPAVQENLRQLHDM